MAGVDEVAGDKDDIGIEGVGLFDDSFEEMFACRAKVNIGELDDIGVNRCGDIDSFNVYKHRVYHRINSKNNSGGGDDVTGERFGGRRKTKYNGEKVYNFIRDKAGQEQQPQSHPKAGKGIEEGYKKVVEAGLQDFGKNKGKRKGHEKKIEADARLY